MFISKAGAVWSVGRGSEGQLGHGFAGRVGDVLQSSHAHNEWVPREMLPRDFPKNIRALKVRAQQLRQIGEPITGTEFELVARMEAARTPTMGKLCCVAAGCNKSAVVNCEGEVPNPAIGHVPDLRAQVFMFGMLRRQDSGPRAGQWKPLRIDGFGDLRVQEVCIGEQVVFRMTTGEVWALGCNRKGELGTSSGEPWGDIPCRLLMN